MIIFKKINYIDKRYVIQNNNIIKFHLGSSSLLVNTFFWKINNKTFYENCVQNYKTQDVLNTTGVFFLTLVVYITILSYYSY